MNKHYNINNLNKTLIETLLSQKAISREDYERVWSLHKAQNETTNTILTTLGITSEKDIADTLASLMSSVVVEEEDYPDFPVSPEKLPHSFLKQSSVIPLFEDDNSITLAMSNPLDDFVVNVITMKCEKDVFSRVALPTDIEQHLSRLYLQPDAGTDNQSPEIEFEADIEKLRNIASEAPVIKTVNNLISEAVEARASDIHFEPFETSMRVRYRVDGVLRPIPSPSNSDRLAIISRIKILANLDIAERRLPQDGRIKLVVRGKEIDMRVSTLPTLYGEGVVLRILEHSKSLQSFEELGFNSSELSQIQALLKKPNGIILVTGPTGSGKTTSLYAGLTLLNKSDVKIVTVEDPIEYQIQGINQIQTQSTIGLDFASVLRSILRHDPDIIMIGEIRDLETALIAIQAALTGHLVISTLHTNSAAASITRLIDMGIDEYLIASTLEGVVAQRLVRKLCPDCRIKADFSTSSVQDSNLEGVPPFEPVGCENCSQSGYFGRSVIAEILTLSEEIKSAIVQRRGTAEITEIAEKNGFKNLFESGLTKVRSGETSLAEIYRVTHEG
ncbi:MAG: GspE/PulE family protein [Sneathiella sp.]